MENSNQGVGSTMRDHLAAKGIELTVVPDEAPNASSQGTSPVALDKEDWKEIDYKLESAVNELRTLERSKENKDDSRIKELHEEIDNIKNEKIPTRTNEEIAPGGTFEAAKERRQQVNVFKLESAKSDLNQLRGKGVSDNDPRIKELLAEIATLENKPVRGGRKSKAGPELGETLKNVLSDKENKQATEGSEELIKEKSELMLRLAEARALENEAGVSEERKKLIQENVRDAQKKFIEFGQQHPELIDPLVDNSTLQRIIKEQAAGKSTAKDTGDALQESLRNGDTEFVTDKDALEKIANFEKQNETGEAAVPAPQTVALISNEQAVEAAKEVLHTGTAVATTEAVPPQSPYAKAMDDRWAEIKANMDTTGQSTGEDLTLEPLVQKPTQLENVPVPVGKKGPHLLTHEEIRGPFPIIEGEFTRVLGEKTVEQIKQEKLEKIRTKLDVMTGAVKVRTEKVGAIEAIRNIGEKWNKFPKRYKYMVAAGMFVAGGGAVALGYVAASRILGSVGLFATFDALLQSRHEKKTGGARGDEAAKRHAIFAGIGALVVVGVLGKVGSEVADFFKGEATSMGQYVEGKMHPGAHTPSLPNELVANQMSAENKGLTDLAQAMQEGNAEHVRLGEETLGISHEEALKLIQERGITAPGIAGAHIEAPVGTHSIPAEKLAELSTIKEGQGFWQPIHNQLAALHPDWTPEHLNHDTQTLLMKNGIINADGSELQISKVGTHIVLHPDNTITYDHGAVYTAVPEPGVHEAVPTHTPETPTMPSEITPASPGILASADLSLHDDVNNLLGSKGIFGIGAQNGMDSISWKDPQLGFANQTVDNVMNAHPPAFPSEGTPAFGINNYADHQKMLAYLKNVAENSGITQNSGEKVPDYIKRTMIAVLTKPKVISI